MMVSLGSAVPVLAALHFLSVAGKSEDLVASDVFRVVQGIMGGIGFLGAGAILQSRHSVHGLTTAATVWVSAAIGVTCAFGYYAQAAIAVGLALIVLFVFGFIEARVIDRSNKPSAEEGSEQMPTR
jgi:putative Mg2+ transporter-C (MgtC) family protein